MQDVVWRVRSQKGKSNMVWLTLTPGAAVARDGQHQGVCFQQASIAQPRKSRVVCQRQKG